MELEKIFNENFSYYKNGDFSEFYSDIRYAGILRGINTYSEIYEIGYSYKNRKMSFPNFIEYVAKGKWSLKVFDRSYYGLDSRPIYFQINGEDQVNYYFYYRLLL